MLCSPGALYGLSVSGYLWSPQSNWTASAEAKMNSLLLPPYAHIPLLHSIVWGVSHRQRMDSKGIMLNAAEHEDYHSSRWKQWLSTLSCKVWYWPWIWYFELRTMPILYPTGQMSPLHNWGDGFEDLPLKTGISGNKQAVIKAKVFCEKRSEALDLPPNQIAFIWWILTVDWRSLNLHVRGKEREASTSGENCHIFCHLCLTWCKFLWPCKRKK